MGNSEKKMIRSGLGVLLLFALLDAPVWAQEEKSLPWGDAQSRYALGPSQATAGDLPPALSQNSELFQNSALPPSDVVQWEQPKLRLEEPIPTIQSETEKRELPWFPIPIGASVQYERIGDDSGWGMDRAELGATLIQGLPRDRILLILPKVGWQNFESIAGNDLPSDFYDVALGFALPWELNDRWSLFLGLTPGFYSDGSVSASDAFRLQGMGLANYRVNERFTFSFGFIYVGRQDVSVIPIAGFQWRPNDDWFLDFAGPKPRIARRIASASRGEASWWWYVGGEFGGGEWAYQDSAGSVQKLAYQDLRLALGIERMLGPKKRSFFAEAGYLFDRQIEVAPRNFDLTPTESFFLRAGISF